MKTILASALLGIAFGAVAAGKPNVIFILADDWGRGDIKAYGGDRCKIDTPNMDALARDGMLFTDAHSSSSVCTPTRYGVLTGRYNWRSRLKQHVLHGFDQALIEPGRETVASFLKKQGYATAMIGKSHLGMDFATTDGKPANCSAKKPDQLKTQCNVDWKGVIKNGPNSVGFDYYWGIAASLDMPPYIWIENDRFVGECTTIKAFNRPGPAHADFEDYDVLPTLAQKTVAFIEKEARTKNPFFVYMPLNSPHTPISPSKAWQGKSKLGPYGDFVMETDWAIGEVVKAVEKAGIAKNTLIIVTADNGCSPAAKRGDPNKMITFRMGDADAFDPEKHYASDIQRGHKADIYEGGHRVPYIARWDGKVKAGSVCNDPICLVDLFATCADIVGQPIADTAAEDSVSILPNLLGTAKKPVREAVVHHSINGSFAIRQGDWKLSLCPGSGGWSLPKPPKKSDQPAPKQWVQLYNLADDPAETTNLADQHPEMVERMTQLAQSYIDKGRSTPGAKQSNTGETHLYPEWIRKQRSAK
ncbi:Arylsulfatase [Pontiella desulfatans]|uniref:Arylsulfatase n=1 Tax=Pontiella desulfatans TaxID=2750659 RepID=A0A6C2U196_PONDE|nr:arylsulfatase [Pontiella desulfatans]SPS73864.1 sulfatase S1_15 [Kiritimatiellales bacterium]VGO13750.1 Arylsulfatase [Pontiella desulfatans]